MDKGALLNDTEVVLVVNTPRLIDFVMSLYSPGLMLTRVSRHKSSSICSIFPVSPSSMASGLSVIVVYLAVITPPL